MFLIILLGLLAILQIYKSMTKSPKLIYGMIEQFSILNSVWAITIVCAEVPSGALADLLGPKRLLVLTSILMIIEMGVIAFVPIANMSLVFWAFLINRIVSGLAEAMASGADEAIAYDSLKQDGDPDQWPRVLSVQMRVKSQAGFVTMTVGALIYDPEVVNQCLRWIGIESSITQEAARIEAKRCYSCGQPFGKFRTCWFCLKH